MSDPAIRPASAADNDAIWRILEPTFREGATYPIPRDVSREDALAYWFAPGNTVFVAGSEGTVSGTYYLRAHNPGGGARAGGFTAMQVNFVVSSNTRAVKLWRTCGFQIVGTLPGAFMHPARGAVEAYGMWGEVGGR